MRLEFCSYNFVSVTRRGSVSIVPTYHNKWPAWKSHWFYLRVCSDEDVAAASKNGLDKAHNLVSLLTPLAGVHKPDPVEGADPDLAAADAFALTSRR